MNLRDTVSKHIPVTILALALIGVVAYASIPGANGVIHGCYGKLTGQLRVFDDAHAKCTNLETEIMWNQTGVPGPAGPSGPQGPAGPQGPPASTLFAHVTADGHLGDGNAISAERLVIGRYLIRWGRSLAGCVATATPGWGSTPPSDGDTLDDRAWPLVSFTPDATAAGVDLVTAGPPVFFTDTGFNIVVTCPGG